MLGSWFVDMESWEVDEGSWEVDEGSWEGDEGRWGAGGRRTELQVDEELGARAGRFWFCYDRSGCYMESRIWGLC
jgi:hypothetical protein